MSDFIPKISKYRNSLAQLLKKSPPEWNSILTKAFQQLKELAEKLPPLQIPGTGKQLLQTDASDVYWAAALFEELDGNRSICGYKSGAFKPSELHYHSTFKEILAVKHGIEKFQFHLLGHNFLVEMDMSSFPKCSSSKGKCSHILSYSDGQIGFHNGPSKSSTSKEKITLSLIISKKPQVLNTTIIPSPLCVYPIDRKSVV